MNFLFKIIFDIITIPFKEMLMNLYCFCSKIQTLLIITCIVFISCNSRQNAITELITFKEEEKNNCSAYSEKDWEIAINHFVDICKEVDQLELTKKERMEVNKIKGEIVGYASTVAAQELTDELKNISDEIESFTEGFNKTFKSPDF